MTAQSEYDAETPFVTALLLWLDDHDLHADARSSVLARTLGVCLYQDFKAGPFLPGAFAICGAIAKSHALGSGVRP